MNPNILPLLAFILASLIWIVDSAIDFFLLHEGDNFIQSIIAPEPVEFWMRSLVLIMMILLSFYARKVLIKEQKLSKQLEQQHNDLEKIVAQRTSKLEQINSSLQLEIEERIKAENALKRMAITDPLTKLYNRRKFDEVLAYEIEKDIRYRGGLSLIMCDIDNFKNINDKYGHDIGDKVLQKFAQNIKNSLRESDTIARWGGEEFIILITNCSTETSVNIAEKIRDMVATLDFENARKITASFGVSHYIGGDNKETFIKRADQALYKAKELGKNRVESI